MIDVCNIFNPLNKETGNFLLFSQYTRDLSKSTVDPQYKIRPSAFVCLDLTSGQLEYIKNTLMQNFTNITNDYNNRIPAYFQNLFENMVSCYRNEHPECDGWNFSIALYDALVQATQNNGAIDIQNMIKYIGKIDSSSWGDSGFADIILNINSGSKAAHIKLTDAFMNEGTPKNVGYFQTYAGSYSETYSDPGTLSGWESTETLPIEGSVVMPVGTYTRGIGGSGEFTSDSSILDQIIEENTVGEPDNLFIFNTIVVLYDIYNDEELLETGIPMGIYFTGMIDESTGEIGNPVTIYSSSDEVYGAGSGWSLRICTRFSPTPHGYLKVEEVAVESLADEQSISALLAANAETIIELQKYTSKSLENMQTIKDMYALFKNYRVNVPYVREVGGVRYWFVNGRMVAPVDA